MSVRGSVVGRGKEAPPADNHRSLVIEDGGGTCLRSELRAMSGTDRQGTDAGTVSMSVVSDAQRRLATDELASWSSMRMQADVGDSVDGVIRIPGVDQR